jgi:endogenous inhibitor of DNA gyrase (YacG/DUF329 family)
MKIKCPHCGNITKWEDNMYKPFCSERCKLVDLGTWANEKFKIEDNLNSSGIKIGLVGEDDE